MACRPPAAIRGYPYLLAAQAQKHVTHNEALRLLGGLVQLSVLDRDLTAPQPARQMAPATTGESIRSAVLKNGALVEIRPEVETRALLIMAVWPPVSPMPVKLHAMIDHLAAELAGGAPGQ